jgi:hypothetical protein
VSRITLFDKEPVAGISGLAGLTAPGYDEDVAAVVDLVVIGAKSDGKTQLITHAIRTLDARGPQGLSVEERAQNEKIMGLVLNPKRPLPEANPDKKVRHYVFRLKPEVLLAGMGPGAQLLTLLRTRVAWLYLVLSVLSAAMVTGVLGLVRHGFDAATIAGGVGALLLGALWGSFVARRDFRRLGEIEVVFWDVAGEDVYSDRGAGTYHSFLSSLVAARGEHQRLKRDLASDEGIRPPAYAFAPALICNPLAVGTLAEDSPFARLRSLMPMFAGLHRPTPEVLVVVNRFDLVKTICGEGDRDADDLLAIIPTGRDELPVDSSAPAATEPLPVVRRDVVQRHCLDGEPQTVGAVRFRMIHYEAGLDTHVTEKAWTGHEALPADVQARYRAPAEQVKSVLEYRYAEGPGSLTGEAGRQMFGWLAQLLWPFGATSVEAGRAKVPVKLPPQPATQEELAPAEASTPTMRMFGGTLTEVPKPEAPTPRGGFRSGT